MGRFVWSLSVLMVILLLPGGCGGDGLRGEVLELLERRSGEIETMSYSCITEDAGRLYREEFELRFPDHYRYRFYEFTGEQTRLLNYMAQSGNDIYRAGAEQGPEGEAISLQVETLVHVPPIRCTGTYLALYHLIGNVDYFQSMIALLEGGELQATGTESLDGTDTYRLESASGLTPQMRIWLEKETGLPLRKELVLSEDRVVVFRYENTAENPGYKEEPFPTDAPTLFGEPGISLSSVVRDGGCQPADIASASAQAGFTPLIPEIQGFELAGTCVRDPAASNLTASEESTQFPEGFREIYLVLRSGARQVEIRESPYDQEFSYYTTGMAAFSGAFLFSQELFGEDAAGASYTAAMDCQEMRLTLSGAELMVTGDLSRAEFESLAMQLRELSQPSP